MRLIIICVVMAISAAAAAASEAAAASPRQGCPSGSDLMTVTTINATITTPGFEQAVADFDASGNGDGLLCVHLLPDAAAKHTPFTPVFLLTDNTVGNPNSEVVETPTPRP
jgi:hypothetical protein